jgi:hypothetical protein
VKEERYSSVSASACFALFLSPALNTPEILAAADEEENKDENSFFLSNFLW